MSTTDCAGRLSMPSENIVDIFNLKPEDINAWDIAFALSHINRYNGCTPVPWDVLSHTGIAYALYMADHKDGKSVPETALAILLHDAAEAYVGDTVLPMKKLPQMAWIIELEDSIAKIIFARFGLDWDAVDWDTVNRYDNMAGQVEIHYLKPTSNQDPYFQRLQVPVSRMPRLGKAQPWQLIGLLQAGAHQFGAKDIGALFAIPKLLEPYVNLPADQQAQKPGTDHPVESMDEADIPAPRSSADVDSMRV